MAAVVPAALRVVLVVVPAAALRVARAVPQVVLRAVPQVAQARGPVWVLVLVPALVPALVGLPAPLEPQPAGSVAL